MAHNPSSFSTCSQALASNPNDIALNYYTAASLSKQTGQNTSDNLSKGLGYINYVIEHRQKSTDWVDAFLVRAILNAEKGNYEAALKDFNACVKIDSKYDLYYRRRAEFYSDREDYDLAIKDFKKAHKLNPKDVVTLRLLLASLYSRNAKKEKVDFQFCSGCMDVFDGYSKLYKLEEKSDWNQSRGLYIRSSCWRACTFEEERTKQDLLVAKEQFRKEGNELFVRKIEGVLKQIEEPQKVNKK